MNKTKCCKKCLGHGLPANLPKVNVAPVQDVPFCLDQTCSCHQSEKPQPEQWDYRIRDILLRNFDNDKYLWSKADLEFKSFIRQLLSAQQEQMLEVVRGMKVANDVANRYSESYRGYDSALEDVEEKLKGL